MYRLEFPKAHLRSINKKQCELTFWLNITHPKYGTLDQEIKSHRQLTDDVSSLLSHTKNKIVKLFQDSSKVEVNADELKEEIRISLTRNNKNVASTLEDLFLFNYNLRFTIFTTWYSVIVNAPLIQELTLPRHIYVNSSVKPLHFKGLHLDKRKCEYTWSKSKEKENWVDIFYQYSYDIKEDDLEYYLKLKCVPKNTGGTAGDMVEVMSENVVSLLPDSPPALMKYREKYITKKLSGKSIRVVSYNVLSERYTQDNQFDYCKPEYLCMGYRKQLILEELMSYNADIMCLQEVDLNHFYNYFRPHFKDNNYHSVCFKKGNIIQEGMAFIFNQKRFNKIDIQHVVLSHVIRRKSYHSIYAMLKRDKQAKELFLKQHTSLVVAILRSLQTDDILVVANTHLYYHWEAGHIRVIQLAVALKYIDQQVQSINVREPGKVSVIFCGDFNSKPYSAAYNYLTTGTLSNCEEMVGGTTGKSRLFEHDFEFVSAVGTPKFTNYTRDFQGCLDYIFCQKDVQILQVLPFPEEDELKKEVALPNQYFPSDHLALVADLLL